MNINLFVGRQIVVQEKEASVMTEPKMEYNPRHENRKRADKLRQISDQVLMVRHVLGLVVDGELDFRSNAGIGALYTLTGIADALTEIAEKMEGMT